MVAVKPVISHGSWQRSFYLFEVILLGVLRPWLSYAWRFHMPRTHKLQNGKRLSNGLTSPGLTKADILLIKGNNKYICFLETVNMTGFLIYSSFKNFERNLSLNLLAKVGKSIFLSFSVSKWNFENKFQSKSNDVITYKPVQICVLIVWN